MRSPRSPELVAADISAPFPGRLACVKCPTALAFERLASPPGRPPCKPGSNCSWGPGTPCSPCGPTGCAYVLPVLDHRGFPVVSTQTTPLQPFLRALLLVSCRRPLCRLFAQKPHDEFMVTFMPPARLALRLAVLPLHLGEKRRLTVRHFQLCVFGPEVWFFNLNV